ncbi:MAG: S8 family serine peptidase [Caldisericia bacterium]
MKKLLSLFLILFLFLLLGFNVKALSSPDPDLSIYDDVIEISNRVKPDITKGIPMISNYVVIDGVKIPKYYADLPIVKEEGKIRLILTLQEPPLVNKGNVLKIKQQQNAVIKYLETKKIQFEVVTKTQNIYNQITIEIPIKEFNNLGKIPYVKRISFPRVWNLNLNYSVPLIQGGQPSGGLGYSGDGIVVGIVDTGIDYNHPDLGGPGFPNSKVIAGYDFGDWDSDPIDCQGHGTHVAGIVAANGSVKGVAKDAQLVAAKIVSGCLGYATSESIIAAFEYLTNLGIVDVINMSFGSDCGFNQPDDPEQIAISNAVKAGITVAISAGNDYYQYYPYIWRTYFSNGKYSMIYPDIGVVGDPSTTPGVISVASSDNSYMQVPYALETSQTPNRVLEYMVGSPSPDPVEILGTTNEYDVQFVGYGNFPSDFSSFVPGRVALMERGGPGDATFVNKVRNAQNAGAIAAIVHNHSSGGDALIVMALASDITIPSIFIGYSDGIYLRGLSSPKIKFTGYLTSVPVPTADQPSTFTSWGLTPFMEGKPEVSAPGGYIYSTVPDGGYAVYSGTSMASPHVAGAAALMLEKDPTLKPEEIKNILMTTSKVLSYYGYYLSPRLQGAGRIDMVNALNAIDYKVFVYGNNPNSPWITGDTENASIFREKIKLVNKTSSPLIYNLSGVRMIWFVRSYLYAYGTTGFTFRDLSLNPITSITVPENGSVEFYMELDMTLFGAFENVFVDGFIFLNPTGSQPALHLPFSILHGDWQDTSYIPYPSSGYYTHNPVIDPPAYDPDESWWWFGYTWLYYLDGTTFYPLGKDFNEDLFRNKIAISPNGDGIKDEVWALLSLLRGSKEIQFKVLDSSKNTLLTPIIDTYVRKNTLVSGWYQYWYGWNYDWVWDGKNSSGLTLPDGNYYFRIQAEAGTDPTGSPKAYDIKDFPLIIDTISPIVNWNIQDLGGSTKLTWNATDERSGIWGYNIIMDGNVIDTVSPSTTSYMISGSPIGHSFVVEAIDFAGNSSYTLPTVYNPQKGYYFQINPENKAWRFMWPSKNLYTEWKGSTRFEYDENTGKAFVVYSNSNINLVFDGNFYKGSFRLILNMKKEQITIHDVVGKP